MLGTIFFSYVGKENVKKYSKTYNVFFTNQKKLKKWKYFRILKSQILKKNPCKVKNHNIAWSPSSIQTDKCKNISMMIFSSIRVFFHGHWGLTGQ